jgi:hypothetical protein
MNTIVLAQILGVVLTVTGFSLLVQKKTMTVFIEDMTRNQCLLWLSGFVALVTGIVLVEIENVWNLGYLQLLLTVIGWLVLIKGLFIMILPSSASSLYRKWAKGSLISWSAFIILVVGLVLLYKGFF